MKNNRKLLTIISLLSLLTIGALAEERSSNDMENVALNFIKQQSHTTHVVKEVPAYNTSVASTQTNTTKEYRIINLEPSGWVIVSKDDVAKPVLAYSLEGSIENESSMSPAFKEWMQSLNVEIVQAKQQNLSNAVSEASWNSLSVETETFNDNQLYSSASLTPTSTKEALLGTIKWGQSSPYNGLTPNHNPVGCSATAMAQIMAYYKWPTHGVGSYSYQHESYGVLSANFDTSYNWTNMSNADYAKISYHVGVSMNMHYTASGSGAWPIEENLRNNFKYSVENRVSRYTDENQWHIKIKNDLDHDLPIWYAGFTANGNGGHAFVLDGYKYENNVKSYHFNWGWSGSADGWYQLNALVDNYNTNQHAIFGIHPDNDNPIEIPEIAFNTTINNSWANDKVSTHRSGKYARYYQFTLDESTEVTIDLISSKDTYMYLLAGASEEGSLIQANDDGGVGLNSKITRTLPAGTYTIEATTYSAAQSGAFTLRVTVDMSTVPVAPSNLEAGVITSDSATLTWNDNSDDETGFMVYNGSTLVDTLDAGVTSYALTNLASNTEYTYSVKAYNTAGASTLTEVTFTTEEIPVPVAPSNLEADVITSNSATLTWNDNSNNETGFMVYNGSTLVATLGAGVTSYALTNLASNTEYTYSVKAYNISGTSTATEETFSTIAVSIPEIAFNTTIDNSWTNDKMSTHRSGKYARYYQFTLDESTEVTIDLISSKDTYMYLLAGASEEGSLIQANDDGGTGLNSKITRTLPAGTYTIEATTYSAAQSGAFTLRVGI